jgi:hypothetical protein
MSLCPICNQPYVPVDVHGHVQCSVCKNNIQPCCQGETCETPVYLDSKPNPDETLQTASGS